MGRKSVATRKSAMLVKRPKYQPRLLVNQDDEVQMFDNREQAKEFVLDNQKNLISIWGKDASYQIVLLDWLIEFKQQEIKTIIS